MDGIRDLGGRQGFGKSFEQRDEASFHSDWERRTFALASLVLGRGCFNTDEFRHAIERLDPLTSLSDGYWQIGVPTGVSRPTTGNVTNHAGNLGHSLR